MTWLCQEDAVAVWSRGCRRAVVIWLSLGKVAIWLMSGGSGMYVAWFRWL